MSVDTFDYILETIKSDLESRINPKRFRSISPAEKLYLTLGAGLRTASKGSSSPDQNQTRAYGASRFARASKSQTTWGPVGLMPDPVL
ncbi:hypothetical protein SFRURICE_015799 [Spodoptera frugiperda]|nr:hypothetical protein SFRURICE_015799 [Spodoptera frugiperda]